MSLEERLLRRFTAEHPVEAARILGGLPAAAAAAVLDGASGTDGGRCAAAVRRAGGGSGAPDIRARRGARLLSLVPAENAADLLRRIQPELREALLDQIDGGARLRPLLVFPEGTAGALMDPQVPALAGDLGLGEVRRRLGRLAAHLALEIYVVDGEQHLRGFADLREVLDERRGGALESLARPVDPLPAAADAQSVGAHPGWGERGTLPVVDERGVYLGAVRAVRLRQAVRDAEARHARAGLEAVQALGDLYRLSLGGVFTGIRPAGRGGAELRDEAAFPGARELLRGYFEHFPDEAARLLEEATAGKPRRYSRRVPRGRWSHFWNVSAPNRQRRFSPRAGTIAPGGSSSGSRRARAAALLARIDPERRAALLGALAPSRAAELEELARYPPGTAGFLMDPDVSAFRPDTSAGAALQRLRRRRARRIHDVFITDKEGRLVGAVPVQELALAPGDAALGGLVHGPAPSVGAVAEREEIVETMRAGGLANLAVVDFDGRLLGVLRQGTLLAAAEQEASADMQTMVGASRDERALSPVGFAVRKRLPWLQINLATAFLASAVVGLFEETIAQVTALAILLPVVAGQSGNSGAQALAVTMRGLVLREIRVRNWPRVLLKELAVGAANGLAVAAVCAVAVGLWSGSAALAAVIGTAMVLSMIVAGMAGAAIPTLLSAFGQDPAQSSSIILTTVTDVAGFLAFLGLARVFAGYL